MFGWLGWPDCGRTWAGSRTVKRAPCPSALTTETTPLAGLILFLPPRLAERDRAALDDLLTSASKQGVKFIGIVSSFRVHLGDRALSILALILGTCIKRK